eukprot:1459107-Amphidinium_carterae.1
MKKRKSSTKGVAARSVEDASRAATPSYPDVSESATCPPCHLTELVTTTTLALCDVEHLVLPERHDRLDAPRRYVSPSTTGGGVYSRISGPTTHYHAYNVLGHAKMHVIARRELAHAIADNIVLVAIRKRVLDMQTGDIYRERLPKAIVDITQEHGFDHADLRL